MKRRNYLPLSIRSRLRLVNLITTTSFAIIALILLISFVKVRSHVNQVVQTQLQQTADNSALSRDLAGFLSRLQLLGSTFYGYDSYLDVEGQELKRNLGHLAGSAENPKLKEQLLALQQQLIRYLGQCQEVNSLILWRGWLDEDIDAALQLLSELVAERTIEVSLQGGDVEYLEQLVLLLSGYRENLLEIALANAEENYQQLLLGAIDQPPPRAPELQGLALRLRTLTAAEPPIDRLGRHLIDQLAYYQHLMRRYQLEMIVLGKQTAALDAMTNRTLEAMARIDTQSTLVAQRISAQIEQVFTTGGVIVFCLLLILGGGIGLSHFNLFRKHISRPMEMLGQHLKEFQQGDFRSPMVLARSDEWGQIESAFNAMRSDLIKSWSDLQDSERRFRSIFDNASEGIYQNSLDGKCLNINPALAKILGFSSPQEAINALTNLREQIYQDPEDRDRLVTLVRKQGAVRGFELRLKRSNGEIFWASINSHQVANEDGSQVLYLEGTINDISSRRAAEESLQKLRSYLQNIIDSSPSILIGVDAECRVSLWNRQAEQISGVAADRASGQLLTTVLQLFDSYLYLPQLAETLRGGQPNRLLKVLSQQDGSGYYDILIYPLASEGCRGAVIHIDDVTERVQIEEMMVQSEKMHSVGALAAGMAHEINNPLAAILQNTQVLRRRLSPALAKNRQVAEQLGVELEQVIEYTRLRGFEQMLESVTLAGQRAARIVENMLSFSRKSSSNLIPHSLAELLERTLELAASDYDLKHKYDFRAIRILRQFEQVPDIPCEASQIQQVLLNLLRNAAQALAGRPDPQIILRLSKRPDGVCLQVEDNGVGMSEANRKRVFEPFFTTKEVGVGTGLGLSVSYFIVTETHRGNLSVSSTEGLGSCFSLVLPAKNRNS